MNKKLLVDQLRNVSHSSALYDISPKIKNLHPADLAEILNELSVSQVLLQLNYLDAHNRAMVFSHFCSDRQDALLRAMTCDVMTALFENLPSDDRADIYNRMSERFRRDLLSALPKEQREDLLRMSSYPEGTAGAEMTSDFVAVSAEMTVAQALKHIRATASEKETIYVIYVLDYQFSLSGTLSLRELVVAEDDQTVKEIMRLNPVSTRVDWPKEQAAELIRHYDLLALPVLSHEGKMLGIMTIDDAMDIEKEQDVLQLARFGGTTLGGKSDLDILTSPFHQMFRVRVFWLALLTVFGVITSNFVAAQEEILSEIVILAAFLAPVIDMGGNTGSQSATLVIRGMALGEIKMKWRYVWLVVRRELPVVLVLGFVIALFEVVLAQFSKGVGVDVMLIVGLSMMVCTILGGIIGALLPFIARRLGTDPATLSSPLITSIMDLLGVLIYFGFAWLLLGDLLTQAG
ncbi:magnesium transporter [Enterobacter cloacae subsp. cloacae]|uniref:magnesium transporter n=1 Tax=Enterobacter cloacae TaxID=550 RepID=UPI00063AA97A|nr:magnesium transporter [Enterobacter cloacae]KLG05716.1 magnesium transporter [Enterobacter cloacae subsp. cloacae]